LRALLSWRVFSVTIWLLSIHRNHHGNYIAEASKAGVVADFTDPTYLKSSHFLVNRDGSITQFVGTANQAFGNGIVDNPTWHQSERMDYFNRA
jgi:N-acetyl-anhydromuramyl-L-alanine amidase AmpD